MFQAFSLALAAGMLATVNPCGFALLPAYLSAFVGLDDGRSRHGAVGRALAVSATLTAGFVTVFGIFGLAINTFIGGITEYLPWVSVVVGIALVILGIWLLLGHEITINIPKLAKGGADGTLLSMYLFGVSYALASLSCTIAPFLAVTSSAFAVHNFAVGLGVFVMYGLGMGLVVSVLTVAVALAKTGVVSRFRQLMPVINRIAGVLMLIAGAYVAYYGWYELRLQSSGYVDDPVVNFGLRIQNSLAQLGPRRDNAWWWALAIGGVLVVGIAIGRRTGSRSSADQRPTS